MLRNGPGKWFQSLAVLPELRQVAVLLARFRVSSLGGFSVWKDLAFLNEGFPKY